MRWPLRVANERNSARRVSFPSVEAGTLRGPTAGCSSTLPAERHRAAIGHCVSTADDDIAIDRGFVRAMPTGAELLQRIAAVRSNITAAQATAATATMAATTAPALRSSEICLVAVSKLRPASEVIACAVGAGQRDFGENYVSELVAKATEVAAASACPAVRSHFFTATVADAICLPDSADDNYALCRAHEHLPKIGRNEGRI